MKQASLVLEDWTVFFWESFWKEIDSEGEVVFNTWMVWYPETITDPSYRWQILVCTFPLQWNYGVPDFECFENGIRKYFESDGVHIRGLIVNEYSDDYSHWESKTSLSKFLKKHKVPAITGIDTRALTKKIREHWVMLWKICMWESKKNKKIVDPNTLDLVWEVSCKNVVKYGKWKKTILLLDMWVKLNIIRDLLTYDTNIIRVPYDYPFMDWKYKFDGILITNWPWDPISNQKTIKELKKAIKKWVNIFWICLWNQLLALAWWAKTYKLKYWHRSQNQPCVDIKTGKCILTSQNHWYAIDGKSLPKNMKIRFKNTNDDTVEWIELTDKPARSVQFHPESNPWPEDAKYLFDNFIKLL